MLRARAKYQSTLRGVLAIAIAAGLILVVLLLPRYLVESRHMGLSAKEQFDVEAGIRTSLIQFFGGAALLAGLYFTARGFKLTREGQITDRYAKAIEHLGSVNADVRIGGIYALERLARDSQVDHETIFEVLASFTREHTRTDLRTPAHAKVEADVQAALSVLARRPTGDEKTGTLDFCHSGLNAADFRSGDFRWARFDYSRLDGALFTGAKLDHAHLSFCRSKSAAFTKAIAPGAYFVNSEYTYGWFLEADLTNTDFRGCDLTGSDFGRRYEEEGNPAFKPANVTNARFANANLDKTNLRGVDLRTVRGLTPEQLGKAIIDNHTLLPERWKTDDDDV